MKAIFAGTFDPFTAGHRDIVTRAAAVFDEVIVAVALDNGKKAAPIDIRTEIAKLSLGGCDRVKVMPFSGLLTDFAQKCGAGVIVRGIRNAADLEYERGLEGVYKSLSGVELVYLVCAPDKAHISSTAVRSLCALGRLPEGYVSAEAEKIILSVYGRRADKE